MMKALRFDGSTASVRNAPVPHSAAECLVRVEKSGVCTTDIEITRGYAGFVGTLGHEFVGIVETDPSGSGLIGRRVVGEINVGCGACTPCLTGDQRHCPKRTVLGIKGRDGAHAEFLTLPARNLLTVPDGVSDDEAVFVEPLAAAVGVLEHVNVAPETKIAVVGDGRLGILCSRVLLTKTRCVTVFGNQRRKIELAEKSGAQAHFSSDAANFGKSFDIVVEASGSPGGFHVAVHIVRPRGTVVLKSTFNGGIRLPSAKLVVDEIKVLGSRCGRFEPALEMICNRAVVVADLISDEFALKDADAALARAEEPNILKVLISRG